MANGHSEEFKRDAVRIALTSGLTRRQVASDLGMGVSTLNKWIKVAQGIHRISSDWASLEEQKVANLSEKMGPLQSKPKLISFILLYRCHCRFELGLSFVVSLHSVFSIC